MHSATITLQTHPCNENRVFPVNFFSQGKTCFHYRDPCNENRVPCNENRFFPVRKSSQGKPCFHYRDGFAVYMLHIVTSLACTITYVNKKIWCQSRDNHILIQAKTHFPKKWLTWWTYVQVCAKQYPDHYVTIWPKPSHTTYIHSQWGMQHEKSIIQLFSVILF